MTARPLHLQASQVGIERATQGPPSVWWQHGESQWNQRPRNHIPPPNPQPLLNLNSPASSTSSPSPSDRRLYSHCQLSLSFYRVINRHTYTLRCAWVHSAPTQGKGWCTHTYSEILSSATASKLHSFWKKKKKKHHCFCQKLISYSNKHKAPIDKKKMSSLWACKKSILQVLFFLCGAQEWGVISIHFHPWHPADNPSPFPDYVR